MLDSLEYCILRNLVEHYSVSVFLVKSEYFAKVPRDSLTLTVLIRCQPNLLGFLGILLEFRYQLAFFLRNLIHWLQGIHVNAYLLFLKVADVSVAGHYLVVLAKKLFYGLCFGWTLHYNQIVLHNRMI